MRPRKFAFVISLLGSTLLALAVAGCGGSNGVREPTAPGGDVRDGHGGGGPPPEELVAELERLPIYPGVTPIDPLHPEGSSTGIELQTAYWASGSIDGVTAFYDKRLPSDWQPEGAWELSTYEKGDAKTEQVLRSFVKGELRLTLTVSTTEKDPDRGNLNIGILIEPGDAAGLLRVPEKEGPLGVRLEPGDGLTVRWQDQPSEGGYRVSGIATYWPSCGQPTGDAIQVLEFGEELAADAAEFSLPEPSGESDSFLKELTVDVFAVGPDGSEILRDGLSLTAEPPGWPDHPPACE